MDHSLKASYLVGATPPCTISNAQIADALGAELSFRLRAYFQLEYGFQSLRYDSITVTKV